MREEQDIFDELATLCTSPGYVHAIAYLCFRDNIVRYQGEMTAKDMQNLFSPERLVRTEMSMLIGLLMKEEIDYGLPTPEITQQYITRTEELLNELHREMLKESFGGLGLKEVLEKGINPFTRGTVLREVIFYGGESGYSFQYRDLSVRKYAADNQWLESNKGFSIETARDVVHALGRLHTDKLISAVEAIMRSHPDQWTVLPGFSFSLEELSSFAGIDAPIVERVLDAFTLPREETNKAFRSVHDFNVANATPILRLNDQEFVLFQQYSLAEALYDSPFYWMSDDPAYRPVAMMNRGRFTEAFSRERLELVFGDKNVHSNVDIYESKGKKVGEIDVLIVFANHAIVLQAKSKRLTLEARKGNDNQIRDDFKKSVQNSYDQAYECAKFLGDPKLRFVDGRGRVIEVAQTFKTVDILCVVSDNYPALGFQARQFLKFQTTDVIQPPFVMDIFTLDVMTEMLDSPLYFLSYVNRRAGYYDKLMASHEMVILSQHLKRNLWIEKKYKMVLLEDDIGADLDVAMSVRRDNVPGQRTPDGILTRIANTVIGRILKEIEARPDPGTVDFGFMLLTLGEDGVIEISKAIETIARKARADGQNHDLTVPMGKATAGLTAHCNDEPVSTAGPRLEGHCRLRKYAQKANGWYGICVKPSDMSLRFGLSLNYKWQPDAEMDMPASHLRKFGRLGKKIGRNDPCPCGSGLKFKKCCLE
jgi:hypothetical protein